MGKIKDRIFQSDVFDRFARAVTALQPGQSLVVNGVAGSMLAFVASGVFEKRQQQVLIVAPDEDAAEKLRDDCALLLGEPYVQFFGVRPTHHAHTLDMTSSIAQIETLKTLSTGMKMIVIASPQSIIEKVPLLERFTQTIVELEAHQDHNFQQLIQRLQEIGFVRKDFVESYGDVAVRGGIVDVFPYVGENPIRLEFWGDAVESIREFDVLSQRSIRELQSVSIVPSLMNEQAGGEGEGDHLTASLLDYLHAEACIILDEPALIQKEIKELLNERSATLFSFEEVSHRALRFPIIINSLLSAERTIAPHPASYFNFASVPQPSFNGSINRLVQQLNQFSHDGYEIYLACDTREEADRLRELIEEVLTAPDRTDSSVMERGSKTGDENSGTYITDLDPRIKPEFLTGTIHSGFVSPSDRLALFTEHEIFGRIKRRGMPRRRRFKGFSQKELQQLKYGDYVVHVDHGIGTFEGLKKIIVGGVEQEVMKLVFLEKDVLYVNLNFINRVQKYSSQESHVPKLNKLGTPEWERIKAKAKKRIKDIARDLLKLYARRKHERGFAFSPDTHWQKELEASFMYEDTPDQSSATSAVKEDMEHPAPMDRLICGDVGFGKTEVAVRAGFKAVMDGKQVAVLVPTTILALQHYNTFLDRLSRYTTRIENLTRFKSKMEQHNIVEAMRRGSVDIVIGTHRLLSKDIAFKDLGLLIIDEEHRFGVTAKEKLRQLKATVDTLTLTATPIPRTLHFSLMGARDLSLINTPPRNRLPIMTEIIPASDGRQTQWQVIREAIVKELHRGGQVYVVHDRVQNIDAIADQVKAHVPEARVHVVHGQMHGHELEKTMLDFLEKKFDVLVATKIIESGLDIPSVNTIIINRADRFGLAELYQLRGRVGRSNVQAYAYLLVPPLSVLPKQTLRRLQAIEEFTELGSGFNLAMRDLEIRGAGNLFGGEQSGFIMEMGFEMYERIVREAVEELRQEEFMEGIAADSESVAVPQSGTSVDDSTRRAGQPDIGLAGKPATSLAGKRSPQLKDAIIESDIEALIPDFYIESDSERLDIYRRLYKAANKDDLQSMREELRDRFGEYPEEVENLFLLVELRLAASGAGFPKISLKGQTFAVTLPDESNMQFYGLPENSDVPFQRIMKKITDGEMKHVLLKQAGKELVLECSHLTKDNTLQRLQEAKKRLVELAMCVSSFVC